MEPDFEELTELTQDYIGANSDDECALERIRSLIEGNMPDYNKPQNKPNKNIKIELDQLTFLVDSDDMRSGQVVYDLEENIAFGQEECNCGGIPVFYDDIIPDDVDEYDQVDWLFEYIDDHPERFIAVDIHYNAYDTMVDFINTIDDDKLYNKLSDAIRGKGAFRRFRYVVEEAGLLQKWYDFKNAAEKDAIREWCELKGYECIESDS